MKYSTVLLAAFATTAFARAVPQDGNDLGVDPQGDDAAGADTQTPVEPNPTEPDTGDYTSTTTTPGSYKPTPSGYKPTPPKNDYKPSPPKNDYKPSPPKNDYKNDDDYVYAPVKQETCDQKEEDTSYKPYFPRPKDYDVKKSPYTDVYWPTNVYADKSCEIKWTPKDHSYKSDDVKIYVYRCDDYSKPYETICEDCGAGAYKGWKPSTDCQPSNSKGGATYRFKFCKKSDETEYTWGAEFPIWNDHYYVAKPHEKPVENQCPPPAPIPEPTYVPAPAPEPTYVPAPVPEPTYAPEPVPVPVYNETAPEVPPPADVSGSNAVRASVSFIVGIAALVTFAL